MKRKYQNSLLSLLLLSTVLTALTACTQDEEAPRIDSVWYNMASRPIEEATCAYPGQTLCVRGANLGDLKRVIVNGTDINLNTLFVYESDCSITFQLPTDVRTTGDYIRVVTKWGMFDYPFVVRPASEQPVISTFSATTLIPGRTLTITGDNLNGAKEVWLPTTYGERVQCELAPEQTSDTTQVQVIIPQNVKFASGQCEIVMEKIDYGRAIFYTEKVYSATTDFR